MTRTAFIYISILLTFFTTFSQNLSEAERQREEYLRMLNQKNAPGTMSAEFSFKTRDGDISSLKEIESPQEIILLFYDPDCHHCIDVIKQLDESGISEYTTVVAVDLTSDDQVWESSRSIIPDSWRAVLPLDPIEDDEIYVFSEMPTLYLLSPDKTVILKETSIPEISDWINRHAQTDNYSSRRK